MEASDGDAGACGELVHVFPLGDDWELRSTFIFQRPEVQTTGRFEATTGSGGHFSRCWRAQKTPCGGRSEGTSTRTEPSAVANMSSRSCAGYRFQRRQLQESQHFYAACCQGTSGQHFWVPWGPWQGDRGGFPQHIEGPTEGEEISVEEKNARREGQAKAHSAWPLGEVVKTHLGGEKTTGSREVAIQPSPSEEAIFSRAQRRICSSSIGKSSVHYSSNLTTWKTSISTLYWRPTCNIIYDNFQPGNRNKLLLWMKPRNISDTLWVLNSNCHNTTTLLEIFAIGT